MVVVTTATALALPTLEMGLRLQQPKRGSSGSAAARALLRRKIVVVRIVMVIPCFVLSARPQKSAVKACSVAVAMAMAQWRWRCGNGESEEWKC